YHLTRGEESFISVEMSVIIRLQNLPWSANALDIRQYFSGLSIPEGGVHIVGGEQGDAFIAFSTDEDARQAFMRNNGRIKEVQITLMLSSRTEMQRVIEQARSQSFAAFMQQTPAVVPIPAAVPAIIPNTTTEVKKESKEKDKKDSRRRSRSKSRDRRDRSRDRDRKDRRHRTGADPDQGSANPVVAGTEVAAEKPAQPFQRDPRKPAPEVWSPNPKPMDAVPPAPPSLLGGFPVPLDEPKRTLGTNLPAQGNGFSPNRFNNNVNRPVRESWPPANQNQNTFPNDRGPAGNYQDAEPFQNRFQKSNFSGRGRGPNRMENDNSNSAVSLEPFYGSYGDIRRFFQNLFINNNGIKFINDSNGRKTGVVYVSFINKKTKEEALNLDGENLNGMNVTVSHIDDAEFEEAIDRFIPGVHDDNTNDGNKFKSRNITKYFNNPANEPQIRDFSCLIVEDLPTYCKEQDILHMFSQHPLVALILTTKLRGGFIAYVKFSSKEVAKKAFEEKSHHVVGGKQVTVKPCKDEEFEEINKKHEVNLNSHSPKIEDIGTECLSVSHLPQKTSDKDIADFFSDIGVIPTKIHLMSNNLGFTGQAYCEFLNTEEASRAAKKHETILGNMLVSVVPIKRTEMERILGTTLPAPELISPQQSLPPKPNLGDKSPVPPHVMMGSHNRMNAPNSGNINMAGTARPAFLNRNFERAPRFGPRGPAVRHRFGPPPQDHHVPPGCTIFIKNLPYRAETGDILEFFDNFHHTGNVSRRYNPNNTPSDEAKITFFNPDEASRAIAELQKQTIWDRQIFLRQE
ncbi:RNA-binding protein 12, partial [Gonioctena quinquepunctata]